MQPARKPMTNDAQVGTYPAHGVMQASPATAPVNAPIALGLPERFQLIASHVHIATDAAMSVFTNAWAAIPFAASAEPALKPNQPNQSRPVPSPTNTTLCGTVFSSGESLRAPTTQTEASAAKPALAWTTMPPAKSSTPHLARKPPPQIQCTIGT